MLRNELRSSLKQAQRYVADALVLLHRATDSLWVFPSAGTWHPRSPYRNPMSRATGAGIRRFTCPPTSPEYVRLPVGDDPKHRLAACPRPRPPDRRRARTHPYPWFDADGIFSAHWARTGARLDGHPDDREGCRKGPFGPARGLSRPLLGQLGGVSSGRGPRGQSDRGQRDRTQFVEAKPMQIHTTPGASTLRFRTR